MNKIRRKRKKKYQKGNDVPKLKFEAKKLLFSIIGQYIIDNGVQIFTDVNYPNVNTIGFTDSKLDLIVNNKNKVRRGKGYKAFTNSMLVLLLRKYIEEKGANKGCFWFLDSPLKGLSVPEDKDDGRVWVMAHLDVVPTGDITLWKTNPFECVEKDGVLYGRGVEDNQQGLVSSVFAALYYLKNGIKPAHTIKLLFAADEENGSNYGIIWLINNTKLFRKSDLVLIPDGGDPQGSTIEIAEKNLLWLQVHVMGKQTHGSRPDSGANACLAAADLTLRLHNLEKIFNKKDSLFEPDYSTFQPTKRAKNVDSINIIPGEDTFCMDCRILPCYKLSDVIEKVDEQCREVEKIHGVKIEYTCPQKSASPATSKDAPVAKKLAAAIKAVHGINPFIRAYRCWTYRRCR